MKRHYWFQFLGLACGLSLLASGCLIKPARVPTRRFVLAPIPPAEHAAVTRPPPLVEVGFVKMPSYLLRDSMVVRKSATELEYLEDALWAERLDQSFRQTLAANLSLLLASDQAQPSASERHQVGMRVSVEVEQFDVDTQGRGTLLAKWRLTFAGSDKPVNSGLARLTRPGPAPLADPQAIATTLSALTAELSHELAQAIRQTSQTKPS